MSGSGREKPLNAIFGAGIVVEMLSWKNKRLSAAMLAGFTAIYFLYEVFEFNFVSLLCYILIFLMLLVFFFNKLAVLFKWDLPNFKDFEISEFTFRYLFDKLNWSLFKFIEISIGNDFKHFLMAIVSFWLLSVIGSLVSSMNLIYIGYVCLQILPVLYERYEEEVDQLVTKTNFMLKNFFDNFHTHVFSKIPRGTLRKQLQPQHEE